VRRWQPKRRLQTSSQEPGNLKGSVSQMELSSLDYAGGPDLLQGDRLSNKIKKDVHPTFTDAGPQHNTATKGR
jgi:hypothetical protein